ncbi:P1 family peptidase [Inquilinus sp. CAU 1745]|uniref:P1 family peptidase n=1 Tax=Inquilinus sp. CAU 1745 TaxID=3140369 RepID=UPI00325B9F43
MTRPGPRNLITDVPGIAVGNAEDAAARTGVTVVIPEERAVAAVDVRGGAPGSRDTHTLDPASLVDRIDAVALSGGSEYGLEAAAGAVAWLAAKGRGFAVGEVKVPVVPAAILFDLANGGDKGWGEEPPYRRLGRLACDNAGDRFALGNAGAGLGAKAGTLKGGLGSASAVDTTSGVTVGAVIAVNPVGSVVMPGQNCLWAWALEQGEEMGGQPLPTGPIAADAEEGASFHPGANTTIGVVALDADLTAAEARRVAIMAQDGLARAIRPVHTPFDGDILFVLATGRRSLPDNRPAALSRLGALAADAVARAIGRGVFEAEDLGERLSYRTVHGHALRCGKR